MVVGNRRWRLVLSQILWQGFFLLDEVDAQFGNLFGASPSPPSKPAASSLLGGLGGGAQQQQQAGGAPSPNTLLNEMRTLQFPTPGGVGAQGVGGMQQPGFGQAAVGVTPGGQPQTAEPDFGCRSDVHAASWAAAKTRFRNLVAQGTSRSDVVSRELNAAIAELKAAGALTTEAAGECGLGKLSLQLVSLATVDDPAGLAQIFSSLEPIASPVLTLLLDVSWLVVAESGWPFFGLLSLINLRKQEIKGGLNPDALDGLDTPLGKAFKDSLDQALLQGNLPALDALAGNFMSAADQPQAPTPLAQFTALAAQAVAKQNPQEKAAFLQVLQAGFKQAVGNALELDVMVSTNWPMWALVQKSIDGLFQ